MKKAQFKELAEHKYLLLDGATGSNLMKAGMPMGVCTEEWILEHPEVLVSLQKAYINAGSNILYAPTFTANRVKLKEYGLYEKQAEIITELVGLSKQAADGNALIAGDITMTGRLLRPMGDMDLEELIDIYKEQIILLEKAGVDLLVVETMMSLAETRAALLAAKEVSKLPVIVTMTFEASGRTLYGTDAKTAAIVLESLGADAVGVNCSTGPAAMAHIIREMAEVSTIPLIAKPNAGLPVVTRDGNAVYDMTPDGFAEEMKLLIDAGATILGGCCGTSPEYIEALKKGLPQSPAECQKDSKGVRYLTSERQTLSFGLDGNFIIVGERINPTGKKKLQEALRQGDLDMVLKFAEEQEADGASVLDVNLGMSGIREKDLMLKVLEELPAVTNLPLSIDSSHVDVLEAALRHYPGRALVNSVSYEKEKMEKLLPIVKKYGAMFILLPLSDKGLPADLAEKKEIIDTICEQAYALGMKKEDMIVDGLVTTVGANKNAGLETLETIRYCKKKGLATICGLSNISFGMPARVYVNSVFLTLAIQAGLTMAIANPSQELLVCSALAADLLLNKEEADIRYIEYASQVTVNTDVSGEAVKDKPAAVRERVADTNAVSDKKAISEKKTVSNHVEILKEAVLKGNRKGIVNLTKAALEDGMEPSVLLNQALLPAINMVGDYFDRKKYFLPQLIAGAEAMERAIQILEPLLVDEKEKDKLPTVVLATVEGDIHDIGKNLVALMLKNHGFKVIDLGKDVPARKIVDCAKENQAAVIGLSALMTTTMQKMKEVICLVKEEIPEVKTMIGGAVITQDYADEIHADGYAKDASEAVKVVKRLVHL